MKLLCVAIAANHLFAYARAVVEFGRDVPVRKRKEARLWDEQNTIKEQQRLIDDGDLEFLRASELVEEFSLSLHLSLSMSPTPSPIVRKETVSPSKPSTLPPTTAPPTSVPTTASPPTSVPPTNLLPTSFPPIALLPTTSPSSDRPTASVAPVTRLTSMPSNRITTDPTTSPSSNAIMPSLPTVQTSSRPTTTSSPNGFESSVPTQSAFRIPSTSPTSSDSVSSEPSSLGTPAPTTNPSTVSTSPSQTPSYTPSAQTEIPPELAFDCVDNGILSLGEASDTNTSAVYLFVGYLVESTSNSTDDFLDELEQSLLLTAVAAALGCDRPSRRDRRSLLEASKRIFMESIVVDSIPCEPTLEAAKSCNIIETDLVFFLKGDFDPDRAAYSGYSAIEDKMTTDGLIGAIPTVLKLVYLSPLPLPAPPQLTEDLGTSNSTTLITSGGNDIPVSPWTIGACVASIFGGVVSMLVWSRNRRNRYRRHMQLVEDSSLVSSARNPVSV